MSLSVATERRSAVLESLLRHTLRLTPRQQPPIELYDPQRDFSTAATFFLLDLYVLERNRGEGLELFISRTVRRLLQQLSCSTERRQVEFQGQVQGRILWPATLKARYTESYDPTRYVCREVRHRYDTPENQLLKYVIEQVHACLVAVPEAIRRGTCYLPWDETRLSAQTAVRLGRMETALSGLRRSHCLREIPLPESIGKLHLLRAQTAQLAEYAQVAKVYRRYRELVLKPSWAGLVRAGRRVLPLPGDTGEAEQRWIQLAAAILSADAARPTGRER